MKFFAFLCLALLAVAATASSDARGAPSPLRRRSSQEQLPPIPFELSTEDERKIAEYSRKWGAVIADCLCRYGTELFGLPRDVDDASFLALRVQKFLKKPGAKVRQACVSETLAMFLRSSPSFPAVRAKALASRQKRDKEILDFYENYGYHAQSCHCWTNYGIPGPWSKSQRNFEDENCHHLGVQAAIQSRAESAAKEDKLNDILGDIFNKNKRKEDDQQNSLSISRGAAPAPGLIVPPLSAWPGHVERAARSVAAGAYEHAHSARMQLSALGHNMHAEAGRRVTGVAAHFSGTGGLPARQNPAGGGHRTGFGGYFPSVGGGNGGGTGKVMKPIGR